MTNLFKHSLPGNFLNHKEHLLGDIEEIGLVDNYLRLK
jgi:hypothetical protein